MSIFSPTHHTFAPHVDLAYVIRTCWISLVRFRWKNGQSICRLAETLSSYFHGETYLFSTGRESLVALLRAMQLQSGEEVILQGYTCVVLPNAIHAAGGVPVYADIDPETLNLNLDSVQSAITPRTRAIICQHTFGIPSDTHGLRDLCDERGILLIEDCAHVLPDNEGPKDIGSNGDVLLLSFGRDKAVSGISGGAVIVRDKVLAERVSKEWETADHVRTLQIVQWLNYPQIYFLARPLIGIGFGKAMLHIARLCKLIAPIVTAAEKHGRMQPMIHKMPNACAYLAYKNIQDLKQINDHRREITGLYLVEFKKRGWHVLEGINNGLPLQKFPFFTKNADGVRHALKRWNIHLKDGWGGCVVNPVGSDLESINYVKGTDPDAEAASEMIVSLPTHPTMSVWQAKKLVDALERLLDGKSA